jgi:uncharacterized MAPEG superfamily protein
MRPLIRWTILIVALLFVMVGGYAALQKSGEEEPNPQDGVFTKTPVGPKHVSGSGI